MVDVDGYGHAHTRYINYETHMFVKPFINPNMSPERGRKIENTTVWTRYLAMTRSNSHGGGRTYTDGREVPMTSSEGIIGCIVTVITRKSTHERMKSEYRTEKLVVGKRTRTFDLKE